MINLKTIDDLADRYFMSSTSKTNKVRLAAYNNHLKSKIGTITASELRLSHIERIIQDLKSSGVASSYIDNLMLMIKTILNYAANDEEVNFMLPFTLKKITKQNKSKELDRILNKSEQEDLFRLAALKSKQLSTIIELLYQTAARPTALLQLKAADVLFNSNSLKMPDMKKAGEFTQPMTKRTAALLQDHIKLNDIKPGEHLFIFGRTKSRAAAPKYTQLEVQARDLFEPFNKDIPKTTQYRKQTATLYSLRHTRITDLVNTLSPAVVQKYVNHSSIEMTMHYVNIDLEAVQAALDSIEI